MRKKQTLDEKFTEIEASFINGQRTQAREQFKKLRVSERKDLVISQLRDFKEIGEQVAHSYDFINFLIANL